MTEKLNLSYQVQKNFSANAAHELRTPLAAIQTQLDVFQMKPDRNPEEYTNLLQSIGESTVSSQNIIEEKINHFEQKNTAFSWGQILLKENDKVEDVLSLLERSPDIQQYYIQYPVPECKIEFGGHSLSVPPKQFGSISNESINIGVMPRDGEIAITPSLANSLHRISVR